MKTYLLSLITILITVSITAQSYDNCTDAFNSTSISAGIHSVEIIDGDLPDSFCFGNGVSVETAEWIKYVPTDDYLVTVSSDLSSNGDTDTRLHIFTGSCGALTCVAGDDDSGNFSGTNGQSYLSVATFNVTSGSVYYIVWDNKWETPSVNVDNFDFELTEESPIVEPPVTFAQNSIGASGLYKRALVDMNGDYLDDIVNVNADSTYQTGVDSEGQEIYTTVERPYIFINYQLATGGFQKSKIITSYPDAKPSWSLAAGDWDANGYNDLLYGGGSGVTFMKANSDGTAYSEISGPENIFSQRSHFVDINNDGHLDAFVCHDVAPSVSYINDGSNNLIYENTNGLGGFASGGNYGSVWIDYDNDRDLDMFMAKCGGSEARRTNQLYRNNGDGTYTEVGQSSGLADIVQTWSSAWGDYDNDGDMDAYIGSSVNDLNNVPPNPENFHKLMRNNGDGTFTNVIQYSVVTDANYDIENLPGDFNNDGFLDVLSNGTILLGNGDLTFTVYPAPASGSVGDANNDGFLDIYNSNLHLNNGNDNNWIKIVTVGDQSGGNSNINGIGARVEIITSAGTQIRDVQSGIGFRHMSSLNTHFGIGTETTINTIKVYWPSGIIDIINNPGINDTLVINEGTSTLGQQDYSALDLILYPNPTKDVLYINTIENLADAFYTVFDINGKRVVNAKLNSSVIDVSSLQTGNYILRIVDGNSIKTQKFIKQ